MRLLLQKKSRSRGASSGNYGWCRSLALTDPAREKDVPEPTIDQPKPGKPLNCATLSRRRERPEVPVVTDVSSLSPGLTVRHHS
ncbi:hypothetical protein JTE90_007041 [Oedothorax gibbosus]|uniref:Uncharacterized protein n=1 Tax=Oedothorax gibbosus TaxID=931172 RepID=A0AAV6U8A5_9ARAC|nr:hypothetical protein JTE90_007041 [Oedothorax gibbosus]